MIKLETGTGEIYQCIYANEDDTHYKDLLKYIKKPSTKYPEHPEHPGYLGDMEDMEDMGDMEDLEDLEDLEHPGDMGDLEHPGYPEFYKNLQCYRIYVKTRIKLCNNEKEIIFNDEIDFDIDVLQVIFGYEYICYRTENYHGYKTLHKFTDIQNIDDQLLTLLFDDVEECQSLAYIPDELKTEEIYKKCLARTSNILHYVPREFRTEEICRIAVEKFGGALLDVPRELKTAEICRIAVTSYGPALKYVPRELKTYDLCRLALLQQNQDEEDGTGLAYVPEELITDELRMLAGL
jgi:hypothetical protein